MKHVVFVPKQLPTWLMEETIKAAAKGGSNTILVVMILQLVLQLVLKGTVKIILDFFMIMQLMVYIQLYNLNLPAFAELILDEFKKLIEFDSLNPESFVQKFINADFSVASFISGVK